MGGALDAYDQQETLAQILERLDALQSSSVSRTALAEVLGSVASADQAAPVEALEALVRAWHSHAQAQTEERAEIRQELAGLRQALGALEARELREAERSPAERQRPLLDQWLGEGASERLRQALDRLLGGR